MWTTFFALFLAFNLAEARGVPIVETNFGTVRGKWLWSARNLSVSAYLGIPYAQPPIAELRFESPKPWSKNWTGIRDATEDGSMCVQMNRNQNVVGDEDCLYLNIFVPLILDKRQLPVLVFVHGGGFNIGGNNSTYYSPDYLLDQGIILVTVNYRLNVFGFLSTATGNVPGNAGLKDVLEALRWIQNNIASFGGDPSLVTLSGHSSGAGAVHHLSLSKSTEGLFSRMITHSGSAIAPWAIHPPLVMRFRYLLIANQLSCASDDQITRAEKFMLEGNDNNTSEDPEGDEKILSCLRYATVTGLANAAFSLFHVWKSNPACNLGPTVERNSADPIISQHPMKTILHGEFRDIPWITGVVADEGLLKSVEIFQNLGLTDELLENFDEVSGYYLESDEIISNTTAFARELIHFYLPPDADKDNFQDRERNLTQMTGDGLITWHSYRALNYQAEKMNSSVYFYLFAYEGTFSATYAHGIPRRYGVAHSDDMNYLFPSLNKYYVDLQLHNTGRDWTMINVMTELWSSFMRTGMPRARMTPDWEPYQSAYRYMRIGSGRSPDISMEQDFLPVRMGFWEDLMSNVSLSTEELFMENWDDDTIDEDNEGEKSGAIIGKPFSSCIQIIIPSIVFYKLFQ